MTALLKAKDVAETILMCSVPHVYRLAAQKRIPHLKVNGMLRFDADVLRRWIAKHAVETVGK